MLRLVTRDQAKPEDYMVVSQPVAGEPRVRNYSRRVAVVAEVVVAVVSTLVAAVVAAWV